MRPLRTALLASPLLFLSALYAQSPVPLDCGQPAVAVNLSSTAPRANLTFNGSQGEAVYIRFLFQNVVQGFALPQVQVVDAYGQPIQPRSATTANTIGDTPIDLSGQGFEVDLPSDSIYTLRLINRTPDFSATVLVTMARLNRPCGAGKTLSCGRSTAGQILIPLSPTDTDHLGQMDTYQFNVNAGDLISYRLLRVASSGSLDTSTGFFMAVYGPDGHVVNLIPGANSATGVAGPGRLPYAQVSARSDVRATVSGMMTILVLEPSGARGGVYYVSATRLNGGCGGPNLTCSSTVDGQIITPIAVASYSLPVSANDVYSFRVARADSAGSFAPNVAVYDSQGTLIDSVGPASAVSHAAASKVVTFRGGGTYTVLVGGPLDGSSGSYTLSTTLLNRSCQGVQSLSAPAVVDGSISGLLRQNVYTLSAKSGDSFLLRLLKSDPTTLFRPRVDIYDSGGNELLFLNTNGLDRVNFTIPADGTYSFIVTDSYDNTQSGSYSFSLLRLNNPANAVALGCGAPATGSFPRSLAAGVYTYTAAAGQSFTLRMLPGTGNPQPSIEVYDPQGNAAGQPTGGGITGVDVLQPVAGSYTIVALDTSATPQPATFALDLMRTVNACGGTAAAGMTTSGVISATAPILAYTIPATNGDMLALRSASTTPGFAAQMELYGPDGGRVDASVFGISRKVAATGNYTVLVSAAAPRTGGGYGLTWQIMNKPAGTQAAPCGGTVAGALSAANQFRYYSLAADAGDTLRVLFTRTADNFAPQVEIFDPTGARIAANSDVTQKVSGAGPYVVLVSPSTSAAEIGSYTIAYQRPNNPCSPVSLTCGQTNLRQVTLPGQLDTFTFNGKGGDVTTIRLANRTGAYSPFVEMYDASGARLATNSNGLLRSVLAADGLYTLLIRDRSAVNLGSYRVSLQDETNACTVNDTEPPVITLIRPTGGEVLPGGTTFRIEWQSDDNVGVAGHTIALSTDAGKTFADPFASVGGNQQSYDWILPGDIAPSRTAVIKVTAADAAGNTKSAASDLLTLIGSGFTPNANATCTYDALNRLTQVSMDDGRTIQYTWDAAGNLSQITISGQ
jgi:YD repeat-containing protein